jgi:hypothetical protein
MVRISLSAEKAHELECKLKEVLKEQHMGPLPEHGEHMTVNEFIKRVEYGGFMDHDGHGHYATATEMLREPYIDVLPSMVEARTLDTHWTHVVWFNK